MNLTTQTELYWIWELKSKRENWSLWGFKSHPLKTQLQPL